MLRVDSPGGSALASEIILDATRRVKAKKPFIVSMGNVAGSGGYYVACGADTIFADEATITGSIGVVGGKLATSGLYDKLGVTFKAYRRGQNAGMLASGDAFTPGERLKMRSWMDEIYGVFKGHVTAIRGNRLKKPIDDLAGGRVYTGKQALELGLVDRIGTLHDADQVRRRPGQARPTTTSGSSPSRSRSSSSSWKTAPTTSRGRAWTSSTGRPCSSSPNRTSAPSTRPAPGWSARPSGRLELINREGVVLMMPELGLGR